MFVYQGGKPTHSPLDLFLPPLTLKDLDELPRNFVFAQGVGLIEHPWFNYVKTPGVLELDGRSTKVKFIATTGAVGDWAIYHSLHSNLCRENYFDCQCHLTSSDNMILAHGQKLYDFKKIEEFVPCMPEVLSKYRL